MTKPITRRDIALAHQMYHPNPDWSKVPKKRGPRSKPNNQPEQVLQIACCKMLAMLKDTLYWSTPNHLWLGANASEGQRMHYMAKQKAMGLLAGVSDLVIVFRSVVGSTVIVLAELKVAGNTLSDHQKQFAERAREVGCVACVIHSVDELVTVLHNSGHRSFK